MTEYTSEDAWTSNQHSKNGQEYTKQRQQSKKFRWNESGGVNTSSKAGSQSKREK